MDWILQYIFHFIIIIDGIVYNVAHRPQGSRIESHYIGYNLYTVSVDTRVTM